MHDHRISKEEVLAAIYADKNAKYTIWSPCTTLQRMHIESYPNVPNTNRLAMKRVLKELFEDGMIDKRPEKHVHYTFKEVAYERNT